MDKTRISFLIAYLKNAGDGFANHCVLKPELLLALQELQQYRDKPLHCPNCDGGHL